MKVEEHSERVRHRVLIVAFHYPPQKGSSGLLRALKFARYLPECNWDPIVLTVHPRAYEACDDSQLSQVNVPVVRTFALDTRRHLSVRGRYPRWLALPDRWASWCLGALLPGLLAIRRYKVEIIFSTFPIASAVLIGFMLHRLTGKPWVVDFRDSMTEPNYPPDPLVRRLCRSIERQAVRHASRLIFSAPSALRMYLDRYPQLLPERCLLIPNGYDEEDFQGIDCTTKPGKAHPLRIVHTGLVYPEERDPKPFFGALARLKTEGRIHASDVRIEFRAPGAEQYYEDLLREFGISDLVHILPHLRYRDLLRDAAQADALLILQAASCDHQIPAKVYEYLRLARPILALATETGDTAALLRKTGGATIINLADEAAIYAGIPSFLEKLRNGQHPLPDHQQAMLYARRMQTYELATSLFQVIGSPGSDHVFASALQRPDSLT